MGGVAFCSPARRGDGYEAPKGLAGYLAATQPPGNGTLRSAVDQGIEMGRPSRLHVECDRDGDRIMAARMGGSAVMVAEGTLVVPAI